MLGLAHLPCRKEYSSCAYTQKLYKLAQMMKSLGHYVIFYGCEGSDVACDEFVQVVPKEILDKTYGDYDWTKNFYKRNYADLAHATFNMNAIREINERKKDGDFLFVSMGIDQKAVVDGTMMPLTIESGVGYHGIYTNHRVFESYAWMHYLYGRNNLTEGNWFDCVIPNFFDPNDFEFREEKGDYFLFMGRLIQRKGVQLAQEVCKKLGVRLLIAGQLGDEGTFNEGLYGEFVGHADPEKRKELLAGARALFVPTSYVGPFEGVAMEAMMSGTPVITTDWGVFNETNLDGITGYHVRTFGEALWATQNVDKLDKKAIRKWAENYSMDRVRWLYQAYLEQLYALHTDKENAWYSESHRGLSEYERYTKFYP
jgi:glycosyltransferase involved in cell wall biosynthesis